MGKTPEIMLENQCRDMRGECLRGVELLRCGRVLGVVAALALSPLCVRAQTFIRVAPPSTDEQNQTPVTAMPYDGNAAQNAAGSTTSPTTSAPQREAILSGGQTVEMVDSNGKAVKSANDISWKNWRPTFYADLQLTYDNNIFIQEHHPISDFVTNFSPGIVLGWGDYRSQLPRLGQFEHEYEIPADDLTATRFLYIDYHPTFEIFANQTQEDVVNEDVNVAGSYQFNRLTVTGHAQYQTLSATDLDIGDRVERTTFLGVLGGTYNYNDKTSVDTTATATRLEYSGIYESSTEILDQTFLSFQYAPKTNIGVGAGLGYLVPASSANQLYEQALTRLRWAGTDKLSFDGTFGLEVRESTNGTDKVNGIFNLALTYLPFDGTVLIFSGDRLTEPSEAELGQDIDLTELTFQAQQRILGRLYLNGVLGYRNAVYERISGLTINRTDNYVDGSLGVGTDVTKYAGIQLAWRFAANESSYTNRSFHDEQVTLQVDFLY
jgi:hypothetical protein